MEGTDDEDIHDFNLSPSIVRVIKSKRMEWAERVARMGEMINAYNIFI
jgi:hypothetical protein